MSNTITIMQTSGAKCSKTFTSQHDSSSYDNLFFGSFEQVELNSISDLHDVLEELRKYSDNCIVNSKPIGGEDFIGRRLVNEKEEDDGTVTKATLEGYSHRWVCVDYDEDDLPPHLNTIEYNKTGREVPEYVIQNYCPPFMRDISYIYQYSSSALMKNNKFGKLHLWVMLDKSLSHEEFKELFKNYIKGKNSLDEATFRRNQVLYVADPQFEGINDPFDSLPFGRMELIIKNKECGVVERPVIEEYVAPPVIFDSTPSDVMQQIGLKLAEYALVRHRNSMHHSDALKLYSSLKFGFGLSENHVKSLLSQFISTRSNTNYDAVRSNSSIGRHAGKPYLMTLAGKTITEIKREIGHVDVYYNPNPNPQPYETKTETTTVEYDDDGDDYDQQYEEYDDDDDEYQSPVVKTAPVVKPDRKLYLKVSEMDSEHPIIKYMKHHKIPESKWPLFGFTMDWYKLVMKLRPDMPQDLTKDHMRLVMMIKSPHGLVAMQGIALSADQEKQSMVVNLRSDYDNLYGTDKIDESKQVIICNDTIDSMYLDNACAITGFIDHDIIPYKDNRVWCLNNEPRNTTVVRMMISLLKRGETVVIWDKLPNSIKETNLKGLIKIGMSSDNIHEYIKNNAVSGLTGTLRLNNWKRI